MNDATTRSDRPPRRGFGRGTRNVVLTLHIVVSVGLLGDSAGFLAVAIRRATSDDPAFVAANLDLLGTRTLFFGSRSASSPC